MTKWVAIVEPDFKISIEKPLLPSFVNATPEEAEQLDYTVLPYTSKAIEEGKHWFLIEPTEWCALKNSCDNRQQLYWDGTNIVVDENWEYCLMDLGEIRERRIEKKQLELDEMLSAPEPNVISCIIAQNKLQLLMSTRAGLQEELFWLQEALKGLDERVANNEPDKPTIRTKLQDRIALLES